MGNDMKHDTDADLAALLVLAVELVEGQGGLLIPKGDEWINDRQTLAKKFIYHLATIQSLRSGMTLRVGSEELWHIDHGSIVVLLRAVVENFIVFAWVLGSADPELSKFRHSTWRYAGLMDRLGRPATSDSGRATQARDRSAAEALLGQIKEDPLFKKLSPRQQKAIVARSDWRLGRSWAELAQDVGLSGGYFQTVYSYLCDYSHSSYGAALQVGQADARAQEGMSKSMLGVAALSLAHFVSVYAKVFESARATLASSSARAIVEKWALGDKNLAQYFPKNDGSPRWATAASYEVDKQSDRNG
jgi:Family of unknown function (DUF5677)